jgi:DNA-binding NtrC family response regulator
MLTESEQFFAGTGRVLLVDDERALRRILQRGLARVGFEVIEAGNGRTALELLRQQHFDVVISDVQMPVMNGLELLEAVSMEHAAVPVVLMSGSLHVSGKDSALRLGAFDFLRKPFDIAELQQSALHAVQSGRARMPRLPLIGGACA